ncbi:MULTISPECIES: hypothetical protein [Eubacterium]|nr:MULTISPECIES: hypothetical protein [Eubacterium]MBU5306005.1 hypothetical protein [Eubacterium callanderi]
MLELSIAYWLKKYNIYEKFEEIFYCFKNGDSGKEKPLSEALTSGLEWL